MTGTDGEHFRQWVREYIATFYTDDDYVNMNVRLKEDHTRRVCENIVAIGNDLDLDPHALLLAEVTALFHDIGRFEQFRRYRTFNDARSENHALLALRVLEEHDLLRRLPPAEREIVSRSVRYHNVRAISGDESASVLFHARLLRDADKLDVYYTVITYYRQYKEDPGGFKLELELPDEPGYTDIVIENILNEQQTDYQKLKTLNDMKLLQLGWVYDVNFTATLKRISKCGYLKMLIDLLPQTEDIEKVSEKILTYVDRRIEQAG